MSNYTKSTNFATKDNLTPGDPLKVVRGTEIDTEYNNIATAIATKTDNASAAITGGTITGITDLAVADGGTGASTAAGALNNLLPSQTSAANKYLQSDGTNASWDAVTLSTADITGTLAVANGGTGVTSSTGTGSVVLSNSPTLVTPALGTPSSAVLTNATGLPISTGVSGLGTGVATFLGTPSSANLISAVTDETGTGSLVFATSPTLVTPALGTPSALVGTNITGTASGLTAGNVTTNANLTGAITSVGNASSLGSFSSANLLGALTDETGTGSAVFATSPTLVTPILGTPTSATLTNATGLPIATGVSGLGSGVATFLATPSSANLAAALTDETGSGANVFATSPTLVTPILGTPTSATLTNATGLPLTTGVTGTLPTANGGTNLTSFTSGGVVYASSSSALATGSALTFDGTNMGIGGTPVSSGGYTALTLNNATNSGYVVLQKNASTVSDWYVSGGTVATLRGVGVPLSLEATGANYIKFETNGSEGARLTSTGLGIGTSSPSAKLQINQVTSSGTAMGIVASSANTGLTDDFASLFLQNTNTTNGNYNILGFVNDQGGYSSAIYGVYTSHTSGSQSGALVFSTRNAGSFAERMRLDSSGNLGLGVTPSAWSQGKGFELSAVGYGLWNSSNSIYSVANTYYNGGFKYASTAKASHYFQYDGTHAWSTAASGTAGDAISFTQAMTLTAAGNLCIGTTSASVKLRVESADADYISVFRNTNASGYGLQVLTQGSGTNLAFQVRTNAANTNAFQVLDNGRVGIGTTAPDSLLDIQTPSSHTANVLIARTQNNTTYTSSVATLICDRGTTNSTYNLLNCYNNGSGNQLVVRDSGNVQNTNNSYGAISDVKLKENIVDASPKLADLMQVKVRSYNLKSDSTHKQLGVIAQELETVFPAMVEEAIDRDLEGNDLGTTSKSVKYSVFVPMLIKAMQEQQALITQLQADIATLKG